MSGRITVEIPGEPHAQGRPRARAFAGHAQTYPRTEDTNWKATAQQHMLDACGEPIEGPIKLRVVAIFTCPKSAHRKRLKVPRRYHAKRPDGDNILKALMDAANGVLWLDDSQVADARIIKLVGAQGERPKLCVLAEEIAVEDLVSQDLDIVGLG